MSVFERTSIFDPELDTQVFSSSIPNEYVQVLEKQAPGITSIVAQTAQANESWYDSLAKILPSLAATYQQKQLLDIQVERARQGLPAIDAGQYGAGVNVGLNNDTQKFIMYGALGLGALFLFSTLARR